MSDVKTGPPGPPKSDDRSSSHRCELAPAEHQHSVWWNLRRGWHIWSGEGGGDVTMSDAYFAVVLGLSALGGVGALFVIFGIPQIEKWERRRQAAHIHPAE